MKWVNIETEAYTTELGWNKDMLCLFRFQKTSFKRNRAGKKWNYFVVIEKIREKWTNFDADEAKNNKNVRSGL